MTTEQYEAARLRERKEVFNTLALNGYSIAEAQRIVDDYDYDIYTDCETLGDIAKAIYNDEAQIVEDLEIASWISVDWEALAKHLNSCRDMFISDSGYGIVVE